MQVAPGYRDHPHALNGASDLIGEVFGRSRSSLAHDLHQSRDAVECSGSSCLLGRDQELTDDVLNLVELVRETHFH